MRPIYPILLILIAVPVLVFVAETIMYGQPGIDIVLDDDAARGANSGTSSSQGTPAAARLFEAIGQVESGGRDDAVGDSRRSRGRYQIGRAYWQDGCEHGAVTWSYDDYVIDPARCRQMMTWYWERHRARTDEERARMHNGGPNGHSNPATLGYWRRVQKEIERRTDNDSR